MFLKNNLSKTHPICAISKASKTNTTTDESIFINATLENKKTGEEPIILKNLKNRRKVNGSKISEAYTRPKNI